MQKDLLKIKNKYGEKMSHLCRTLFPTLLETEGLLYSLIESTFAPNKFLYDDIIDNDLTNNFKDFIYSLIDNEETEVIVNKTPQELLDEAGYVLYECKTEEDIKIFEEYYTNDERLCTFKNKSERLKKNHVFFAVKKNVDEIKRENFHNPKREDEYGTSVMSFQLTKGSSNTLSIKNRYNHTVVNPDSTFSNNLDNIILGLTTSFEKNYNLNIGQSGKKDFGILNLNYVRANDGKFYKYNYEIDNIHYCPDNIILDNREVKRDYQEKERYIVLDYFILDMKNKEIKLYDNRISDCFPDSLKNIDKIQIKKEKDRKHICLEIQEKTAIITLDKENRIISYKNDIVTAIGDDFLKYNKVLKTLYLEKTKIIGNDFLFKNNDLKLIYAPSLVKVGDYFLFSNMSLDNISMESLKTVGNYFLRNNKCIKIIYLPKLQEVGNNFLYHNLDLTILSLPSLIKIGDNFISKNKVISEVYLPLLEEVGKCFLHEINKIKKLSLPRLKKIGMFFMYYNQSLESLELPSLEKIGVFYLYYNTILNNVIVPENMWNSFIYEGNFATNFRNKKKKLVYN